MRSNRQWPIYRMKMGISAKKERIGLGCLPAGGGGGRGGWIVAAYLLIAALLAPHLPLPGPTWLPSYSRVSQSWPSFNLFTEAQAAIIARYHPRVVYHLSHTPAKPAPSPCLRPRPPRC
jgi:hypothetical protein